MNLSKPPFLSFFVARAPFEQDPRTLTRWAFVVDLSSVLPAGIDVGFRTLSGSTTVVAIEVHGSDVHQGFDFEQRADSKGSRNKSEGYPQITVASWSESPYLSQTMLVSSLTAAHTPAAPKALQCGIVRFEGTESRQYSAWNKSSDLIGNPRAGGSGGVG